MAAATAVLLDRNFLPPDGGDIGDPGFHTEGSGRWYRLDFPIRMPRRKCLQMVKRAVAIMSADNA